jgi:uncharacterized protein (DUF1684 family)
MRFILAVLLAIWFAAHSLAEEAHLAPKEKWDAELISANEAWATKRLAILKIDDAVYLKDGQTAYLMFRSGGRYQWSLSQPRGLTPSIKYANGKALMRMLGEEGDVDLLTREDGQYALNDTIDLKAQIAQVEPGIDGLRLIVYNQDNPTPKSFKGVDYYPYNAGLVVQAKFEPAVEFKAEDFQTSRGWWKRFYKTGEAVFKLNGKEQRLPFYTGSAKKDEIKDMSAFFMDALTGKETYGVGRYIDIAVEKFPVDAIAIDFNFAYNPNCALSPHYNCPQAKVTLAAEIRAGEKKPSEAVHN